jgi:hypothetical protein
VLCAHIYAMGNRPCRADADLKRIWQLLLPDTPFPACDTQENADARDSAAPPTREDAKARRDFRRA